MKVKLLFFLQNLNGGGAEKVTINIIKSINKNKFEIYLVLSKKSGVLLENVPSYVKIIDLQRSKTIYSIPGLRKTIKNINPDIVFSSLIRTNIAVYLATLGMGNRPTLVFRSPNSPQLLMKHGEIDFLTNFFLKKAYNKAENVIAQTPEMKNEIATYYRVPEEKISVILNPVDTDLIDKKISIANNPFNEEYTQCTNIVAAGRLARQKGFDVLIRAFKNIVTKNDSFRLHLIGEDRGEKEKLEKLICKLDLEKYITFWGYQTNPYKFYYYADLYVLSSRWEGMPNTVLENIYLKKPIVATNCIPFLNSLIQDGQNGYLVDVEDVDGLAKAILQYKKLNPSTYKTNFGKSTFDSLFYGKTTND